MERQTKQQKNKGKMKIKVRGKYWEGKWKRRQDQEEVRLGKKVTN